jgi:HSP20 family protein
MNRLFDDEVFDVAKRFVPEANIVETEKTVEVTFELPGMKPEDLKVEMIEGSLHISGEKHEEKEEKGKTIHRLERRTGAFRRVMELPASVDEAKVDASFVDGILKVTLPKSPEASPKAIPVKVGRKL